MATTAELPRTTMGELHGHDQGEERHVDNWGGWEMGRGVGLSEARGGRGELRSQCAAAGRRRWGGWGAFGALGERRRLPPPLSRGPSRWARRG